jgi:hypothetical protein
MQLIELKPNESLFYSNCGVFRAVVLRVSVNVGRYKLLLQGLV